MKHNLNCLSLEKGKAHVHIHIHTLYIHIYIHTCTLTYIHIYLRMLCTIMYYDLQELNQRVDPSQAFTEKFKVTVICNRSEAVMVLCK